MIAHRCDPGPFVVMHTCDSPGCVRPDHLKLGTVAQNIADRVAKGRNRSATIRHRPIVPKRPRKTFRERFEMYVQKTDGCWLWIGGKNSDGYGTLYASDTKRVESAHRVSWRLNVGPIPKGINVLHRCDCRNCTRPNHLFLGTQLENNRDRERKGRGNHARGERHGMTPLTEADVREIRRLHIPWKRGHGYTALSHQFGITREAVRSIVLRLTWKHVS